jgi:hypothetical protein
MQIEKALIPWWLHVKDGAHLPLTSECNAVKARPISIGTTTGAFPEILADAGCSSQALDAKMSGERQCRDAVIELERKVIGAKWLSHE